VVPCNTLLLTGGTLMGLTTRGLRAMQLVLTWWSHATHCSSQRRHWCSLRQQ